MPLRQLAVSRTLGGSWSFRLPDGPVDAIAIIVADESVGELAWSAISDAFSEQTYAASVAFVGDPITCDPEDLTEEKEAAELIAAFRALPEAVHDRSALRPVSDFEYGVAPRGFRTEAQWSGGSLTPGHRYSVSIIGKFALPLALGTFAV